MDVTCELASSYLSEWGDEMTNRVAEIRARCEAAISNLSDGRGCAECPDYGEPNGCNRPDGPCDAYDVCQDAADVITDLLSIVDELTAEIERMRGLAEAEHNHCNAAMYALIEAKAEIERLREAGKGEAE